jgi:hypothetical protein
MTWSNDMDGAPEGKRVLVCVAPIPELRLFIAMKTKLGLWLAENMQPMEYPPTHWMPLPAKVSE